MIVATGGAAAVERKQLFFGSVLAILLLAGPAAPATTTTTTTTTGRQTTGTAAPAHFASNAVTPAGVFQTDGAAALEATVSQVFDSSAIYDDFDVYVPYRSDELDHFSWSFLKRVLLEEKQQNVIISPFSVKLVLALLSEAAGPDTVTQKELTATLTDIRSLDNLRGFYKKVLTALKVTSPHYTLNLETRLFTDTLIEPQQRYAAMLASNYDTGIERLHFEDGRAAANRINQWCSNVTHGRLQQLVDEQSVRDSVMLLANAIYFNGLWRRQFNETFEDVYYSTPTKQLRVQYMRQLESFYYHDSIMLDARILRLPYKGKKFAMFVVLPKSKGGIDELIKALENEQLKRMQWLMDPTKVLVTLPKFKFEFNKDLKETLQQLGINAIFTEQASLPALARGRDISQKLKVSNIYQKAGIDVNERGTEAFASTVVEIENKFGGNSAIEEFNVNRPFVFFIEEETTGNVIFAGKVLEPYV